MKKEIFIVVAILTIMAIVICNYIPSPILFRTLGENGLEWNIKGILFVIVSSVIGIIIPVLSLFSIRGLGENIFSKKKNIIYLILNIIIIFLVVLFSFALRGFGGGLDGEVGGAIERLFG
ncbi:MAG: hypothetical protein KJ718_04750 [Nanoarchaeota archaeon]|nr:hypothetical protein [Nanoarchaeota archaeon]MBU1051836.1 hypothetical protein [Nanoarchaeota archaeon]MBU1988433.1 hypothetical protein [Nanoarchaeota archaeon]